MTVTVYAKPGCPPCNATIKALEKLHIAYVRLDVTDNPAALEACQALGYLSAPVVVAGDDHWQGFRPDRIAALVA